MRADHCLCVGWLAAVLLAGCAPGPRPAPSPEIRVRADDSAALGVQRYARGDYGPAQRAFEQALQLCVAMDDTACADRQRLNLARSLAALGREGDALVPLAQVSDPASTLEAGLLEAQLRLATGQPQRAERLLAALRTRSLEGGGAVAGRWWLLTARLAWARQNAAATVEAVHNAQAAWGTMGPSLEVANAWRLLAAAELRTGSRESALASAQAALDLDRQSGLPEKIANDWLLIGSAQSRTDADAARRSYRRAFDIAQAAGLPHMAEQAQAALAKETP